MKSLQRLAVGILLVVGAVWAYLAWVNYEAQGAEPEAVIFGLVIVDSPVAKLGMQFFGPLTEAVCAHHGGKYLTQRRPGTVQLYTGAVVETVEIIVMCWKPQGAGA